MEVKGEVGLSKGNWGKAAIANTTYPSFSTEDVISESSTEEPVKKTLKRWDVDQSHET